MQYHSPKDGMGSPYPVAAHTPPTGYPNGAHPIANGLEYMHPDAGYHQLSNQRGSHQSPSGPQRPSVQTNVGPYGVLSPASTHHGYHSQPTNTPQSSTALPYVSAQNFPPISLPPSDFAPASVPVPREAQQAYAPATSGEYSDQGPQQPASDMMLLDSMSMPATIPVFGCDGVMNKSPHVGMSEDFMAYLFNSGTAGDSSPIAGVYG